MAVSFKLKPNDFELLISALITLVHICEARLGREKSPKMRKTQKEMIATGTDLLDRMVEASVLSTRTPKATTRLKKTRRSKRERKTR
jgi:hypothetical protein